MLDKYVYGEVNRLSPEAPVPILDIKEQINYLGGAANVANNIKALGGEPFLFGYVGEDYFGRIIKDKLKESKIKSKLFKTKKTTLKIRFGYPHILRVDEEEKVDKTFDEEIIKQIKKIKPSIIIISDYAKGSITQKLFNKLKKLKVKLIVDPKPKNKIDYTGCYLIVPNLKESKELIGKCKNVLVTMGAEGMKLGPRHFPTEAKEIYDVTGAGDTVIASLAVKLSQGETLINSIIFANKMAGKVVSKRGTSTIK